MAIAALITTSGLALHASQTRLAEAAEPATYIVKKGKPLVVLSE